MKSHWLKLALSSLILTNCATVQPLYPRGALVKQILRPWTGYHGLTNRACTLIDQKGDCAHWSVIDYVLEDAQTRASLSQLVFICNVAGKRYKVCPDKPGLCRRHCDGFLFCQTKEDFLPIANYQFLIDADTKCGAQASYNFWEMP
jgi:hypothetical protein